MMNMEPIIRQKKLPSRRRRDGLIQFGSNITSQSGEDGVLGKLFSLLPFERTRFCVDVGAWDGIHLSNTYNLLVNQSDIWSGVLIEADAEKYESLLSLHGPLGNSCRHITVSCLEESPHSLTSLLHQEEALVPEDFDFLCIDVDGSDYWLLHDVLTEYTPKVICIEFNPTMPHDLVYIPQRCDDVRHGASLAAIFELACEQNNYVLVETTLYNAFFVTHQLYEKHLSSVVPEPTMDALHEVTMGTSLYQLYDGTLKLWGCKKLLWHRIPLHEQDLQVLSPDERTFPYAPSGSAELDEAERTRRDEKDKELHEQAVDISSFGRSYESLNESERKMLQQERIESSTLVWQQLSKNGFALVRGTGVGKKEAKDALTATNMFFHQAPERVRTSCLSHQDRARRGYSPPFSENFASLLGTKRSPNDNVRKFRIGPTETALETTEQLADQSLKMTSSPLLSPNVWPSSFEWNEHDAEFFRSSVECYYRSCSHAAHAVTSAICDAAIQVHPELEQSLHVLRPHTMENELVESKRNNDNQPGPSSILTLLGYSNDCRTGPKQQAKKKKMKPPRPLVAPHTDVGLFTMLLFDNGNCATLQRQDADQKWIDVVLPSRVSSDPVFVINIGDLLQDLCAGLLPSTLHRVMSQPSGSNPRNCCALFVGCQPDQKMWLPQQAEMVTFQEWRKHRIAKAQNAMHSR